MGCGIIAKPALAGFEFKPVLKAQASSAGEQPIPTAPAVPAPAIDMAPLPGDQHATIPMEKPVSPPSAAMPVAPVSLPAVRIAPQPQQAASVPTQMAPAPSLYERIDGFGHDMPLALALRQIVPTSYAFSFDREINPGQRIDWNGGKAWDQVLDEALAPHGLKATITAGVVRISSAASVTQPVPVAPLPQKAPSIPDSTFNRYAPSPENPVQDDYKPSYPRHEPMKHANSMDVKTMSQPSAINTPAPDMPVATPSSSQLPVPETSISHQDEKTYVWPSKTGASDVVPPPPFVHQPLPPVTMKSGEISSSGDRAALSPPQPLKIKDKIAFLPKKDPADALAANIAPAGGTQWLARKGQSLKLVLEDWSQKSGTELYWNSMNDYILPQDINSSSGYIDAIQKVLSLYDSEADRPIGKLHKADGRPNALVIETYVAPSSPAIDAQG